MKTLQPTSSQFKVPSRDENPTEFEVQAWLFNTLKELGFDVRGEIQWRDKKTRQLFRFDLVIYERGVASDILEIKANPISHKNGVENTRQARRYRSFGIPVTFIYGYHDARAFVTQRTKEEK